MLVDDGVLHRVRRRLAGPPPTVWPRFASRPRSTPCCRPASSGWRPTSGAVAERASVVGRVFEQAAVAELATDDLRPEVGRSLLALVRKELVRPERSRAVGRRRLQVPPHPHPRRRLRGPPEVRASDPARTIRRLARADRRRAPGRVRGDRRLSPRAGPPLPDRARRDWPAGRRTSPAGPERASQRRAAVPSTGATWRRPRRCRRRAAGLLASVRRSACG